MGDKVRPRVREQPLRDVPAPTAGGGGAGCPVRVLHRGSGRGRRGAGGRGLEGPVLYLDLDTVVVGPLAPLLALAANQGWASFITLATDKMFNEQRLGGYNSSVMMWNANDQRFTSIYSFLEEHQVAIQSTTYKFDHWLEMVVTDATLVQYCCDEMLVLEYAQSCKGLQHLPENCSIVCFPLQPKPHQCPQLAWLKNNWHCGDDFQKEAL